MIDTVIIDTSDENPGPTLEQSAQEMGLDGYEERPQWLPEKFQSAEDLAKAYRELEGRMSRPDRTMVSDGDARSIVTQAGLDFEGLASEFWTDGYLSEASYQALAEAGIPPHIVDNYIDAQSNYVETQRTEVMREVGEGNTYNDLVDWALNNLDGYEIEAYNRIMDTNDMDAIKMAVRGLVSRKSMAEGFEPTRNLSGGSPKGGSAYESVSQLMVDMQDARYESDPAFRAKVEQKLARSNIL